MHASLRLFAVAVACLAGGCDGLVAPSGEVAAGDAATRGRLDAAPDVTRAPPDVALLPFDATATSSCAGCLAIACEDPLVQCGQAPSCYAAYQCGAAQGSGGLCACLGAEADPTVSGPYLAAGRCVNEAACGGGCASLCAGAADVGSFGCADASLAPSCEGVAPVAPASSVGACEACVVSACGEFRSACGPGSDCQRYIACLEACAGSTCVGTCGSAHPGGQRAADELDVCLGGNCQAACGY